MTTILQRLLLVLLFSANAALGGEPVTTELIRQRGLVGLGDQDRLKAVLGKAQRGESITVAAIGGSITAGGLATKDPENRYINRIAAWFIKTFPKSKVSFTNAGIGGTNSYYGALRLREDVLTQHPDLVVVEYAVNNMADRSFAESYEGLLRQLLLAGENIAVIELFFMHKDGENAQTWQEMLGRHYQLPMISFRDAWWPELSSGRTAWTDLYADEVHPKDAGHIRASELLIDLLEKVNASPAKEQPRAELPPPLISDGYAHASLARYQNLAPAANKGWGRSADGKSWEGTTAGASIEFEFTGQMLFVAFDFDKMPTASFAIDGGTPQPLKADAHRRPLATGLAAGSHRVRIELSGAQAMKELAAVRVWAVGSAGSASPKP